MTPVIDDITANRHGGDLFSYAASQRVDKTADRAKVLRAIRLSRDGATCDEVADWMGRTPNQISGRFTELKAAGEIVRIGRRKTKSGSFAGVYKATTL